MSLTLKTLIELTVPQYLLITILSTISASLIINQGIFNLPLLIFAILSLSFSMLGFNVVNMISDAKLDAINKPLRPIPSGRISLKKAKIVAIILYSLGFISALFTKPLFLYILLLFIVISFLYTVPKIYLKKFIWSTPIIGGIIYGSIPFLSAWAISAKTLPIIFFLFFTALVACIATTKDLEDIAGEKKYRIKSVPMVIGIKNTLYLISIGLFLILLIMIMCASAKIINSLFIYPSLLSFLLLALITKKYLNELNRYQYKDTVTQAKIVTSSMLIVVLIELSYGITSVFI